MDKLRFKILSAAVHIGFLFWMYACTGNSSSEVLQAGLNTYSTETKRVVVVVIDGPRYADTWGKANRPYIPYMAREMAAKGTLFTNFHNEGSTLTIPGHAAILTGKYQRLKNNGSESLKISSVFQHYLKKTGLPASKAAIIASKHKLHVLANTQDPKWKDHFLPEVDSGLKGQNRADAYTLEAALATLQEKQPNLLLLQFMGPDVNAHANNWTGYLEALTETDKLVYELWQFLQQNPYYKDKTTLLITNDHGRHADDHKTGFVDHGDNCSSCEHISLLALGPDFPKGAVVHQQYQQTDLAPTIAQLLGITGQQYEGSPILPLPVHNSPTK